MKRPMPPPDADEMLRVFFGIAGDARKSRFITGLGGPSDEYLPWDKLRHKTPPGGLTHEEWWSAIRFSRRQMVRRLPLVDAGGRPFGFSLPDKVLRALERISRDASGQITISEQVTNPGTRDRYLVNSLIEEAINSSQLEGASTSRKVAKEMLQAGRAPRSRDERMIVNNFQAMRLIGDLRDQPLTPDLVCEIHRVVTDGTLKNPAASGRFQLPGEERVSVSSDTDVLLHEPPPAASLPERMERLCRFANGELDDGAYIPPVLRAITLHFMIGYDHPFEDGNGRTARALFYWSMLNQGYWLTEFVVISQILKAAPVKYAHSYLYSEEDENDLTYFHLHQLDVLQRSIANLHAYLARKAHEAQELQYKLAGAEAFNHRQLAVLEYAARHPGASVTAQSHMTSHDVVYETARKDLTGLEGSGLLVRRRVGRAFTWSAAPDLDARLREIARAGG